LQKKIKTHNLYSSNLFQKKSRIYEIMWENTVETDHRWDHDVGQKIRFACWIRKAQLQTLTKIISYLLYLYGKTGCANAPQCYVMLHCLSRLFCLFLITNSIYFLMQQ